MLIVVVFSYLATIFYTVCIIDLMKMGFFPKFKICVTVLVSVFHVQNYKNAVQTFNKFMISNIKLYIF